MANKKERLDILLTQRGLADSRNKAQSLIMAGDVFINGQRADKAGMKFSVEVDIDVKQQPQYVSRGGNKLEGALEDFAYAPENLICADVGASTGGFTDCLLQNNASKVYAIDVGYGQLAHKIRVDPRVVVVERTNARYLEKLDDLIDLVVIDASFISLGLLLPVIAHWVRSEADVIALIKPQFEAGKSDVGKGGVVRDTQVHARVIEDVATYAKQSGFKVHKITTSPIKGPAGNVEFLIWLTTRGDLESLGVETWIEENLLS